MDAYQFLKVHYDAFHLFLKQECEKHGIDIKFRDDFLTDVEHVSPIDGWCSNFHGKGCESGRFHLIVDRGWKKIDFVDEVEMMGTIRAGFQTWTFKYHYVECLNSVLETNAPLMDNNKREFV